jgi:hypothetical protein
MASQKQVDTAFRQHSALRSCTCQVASIVSHVAGEILKIDAFYDVIVRKVTSRQNDILSRIDELDSGAETMATSTLAAFEVSLRQALHLCEQVDY